MFISFVTYIIHKGFPSHTRQVWLREPQKPIPGKYTAKCCSPSQCIGIMSCKRRMARMTTHEHKSLDTTPAWISTVLWLGVAIVVVSFLALVGVLVYYFAGVTPAIWLFWLALLAFPTGFLLILVALVGNILVRRKRQYS